MTGFLAKGLFHLFIVATLLSAPARAFAEEDNRRLALVIGNASYGSVSALDNPANDARMISTTLQDIGFTVTMAVDLSQIEMKRAIAQFGRDLRAAGEEATGLFYYAGHGVQSFGNNYLLPVDVALSDAADLDLMAVEAQSVLRQMASARNRTNLVILDACRNNPFEDVPDLNQSGLAEMKAPTGTFLAYATAPGSVALDGQGENSPFTQALVKHITRPGQPVEQAFKEVRREVLAQSAGLQTPWDTSSLVSDFMFVTAPERPILTAAETEELQLWRSVRATRDPVQLMLFLRGYPESAYAEEARAMLAEVMAEELSVGAPAPETSALASTVPDEAETALFKAAQEDGSVTAYEAYLQSFPEGTYAEIAMTEIAALQAGQSTDPIGEGIAPVAEAPSPDPGPEPRQQEAGPVTYASPLVSELSQISGLSLAEIIEQAPMFPPIEGLPESYWKTQTCSSCHQWNRDRLCEQANTYLSLNMQRSLNKQHPFGGVMKRSLKSWAAGGCQ